MFSLFPSHDPCPKCGHENFYFNVQKRLGYCHRAKCHNRPKLSDLIDIVGYRPGPSEASGLFFRPEKKTKQIKVELPSDAIPVKEDLEARDALQLRGISGDSAARYQIHSTQHYIIVPVFHYRKLVNLVQRRIQRGSDNIWDVPHKQRYLYLKGVSTSKYLFNYPFESNRHLTLVENSFNTIWLNDTVNLPWAHITSTNFGSHLSDAQIELIIKSDVETVFFLWDQGAIATDAITKLKKAGIRAGSFFLKKGQPDDYTKSEIIRIIDEAHLALGQGRFYEFLQREPLSMRYKI